MNYSYIDSRSHKVFKRNKFIYKFYKRECNYYNEKNFYLDCKDKIDFIPKLIYYSDKRKLLILKNEGVSLNRKQFASVKDIVFNLYKKLHEATGYFHNDLLYRNVVLSMTGQYLLIDFERTKKVYKKISKDNGEELLNMIHNYYEKELSEKSTQ